MEIKKNSLEQIEAQSKKQREIAKKLLEECKKQGLTNYDVERVAFHMGQAVQNKKGELLRTFDNSPF